MLCKKRWVIINARKFKEEMALLDNIFPFGS
jgi:hypothetical protein